MQCDASRACPEGFECERFGLSVESDAGPGEGVWACSPVPAPDASIDAGETDS